jgi:leucyl-tRNA---protein transferase
MRGGVGEDAGRAPARCYDARPGSARKIPAAGAFTGAGAGRKLPYSEAEETETRMDIGPESGDKPRQDRRQRQGLPLGLLAPLQQFFASAPVACPYLPARAERKLIVELRGPEAAQFYDELSRAGFRRSHRFAYRPACRGCAACVPVRIVAAGHVDSASTRRIRNANRDLAASCGPARATQEQFRLFLAYQRARHADSDMAAMRYGDYRAMVEDTPARSEIVEFREPAGRLLAAGLIDRLDDGISAVYSFYDPLLKKRSLGTWTILWMVEECHRRGLPYVYLGYWVAESRKMAYKASFRPSEVLACGAWRMLTEADLEPGGPEDARTAPLVPASSA